MQQLIKTGYIQILIAKLQTCCQILQAPAYGPVNHENRMFAQKRDKGSHLIYIHLVTAFHPSYILCEFQFNFFRIHLLLYSFQWDTI